MRFGVINIDGAYVSAFDVLQEMSRDDIEVYHYNDSATYHVPPHQHDFYELYCLLNGPFTFHVENNRYALKPGSLLLVQPGEVHWPELEQPPRDIERIVLWLNPQFISSLSIFLPQTLGTFGENLQKEQLIIPEEKTYQVILGLLYSLLYEKNRADADSPYLCHLILSQLLVYLGRAMNEREMPPERLGARYREIMLVHEYINAHFKEELTVNDLAEHFYMDKNTLTRQFKRIIGMTPGDYIRRKRLETAHALIRQGYSVLNAGYSSGFSDYSAFYRAFCHLYGQAPSTFSSQTRKTGRRRTATESEE